MGLVNSTGAMTASDLSDQIKSLGYKVVSACSVMGSRVAYHQALDL